MNNTVNLYDFVVDDLLTSPIHSLIVVPGVCLANDFVCNLQFCDLPKLCRNVAH